jgi:hypothetical protein
MKFLYLLSSVLSIMVFGCNKPEETNLNPQCTDSMLEKFDMVAYTGQKDFCDFLSLYEFDNKEYYSWNCCQCYLIPNAIDCDSISFIFVEGKYDADRAKKFFTKAKLIGIVGVSR